MRRADEGHWGARLPKWVSLGARRDLVRDAALDEIWSGFIRREP